MKTLLIPSAILLTFTLSACGGSSSSNDDDAADTPTRASVGKKLFFDQNLSSGSNQACASCHDPDHGFADPDVSKTAPVSEGSVQGVFGNRNAPTAAYAKFIPEFGLSTTAAVLTISKYQGGQFLDGRRPNLTEQAKDPFLNPKEMNNTDAADVVNKVKLASYADEFKDVFGQNAFDDTATAYQNIASAIAAFEETDEVNPFTSKFDAVMAGNATFSASEQRGFDLFKGDKAKCANCHTVNQPAAGSVFTDFKYFNIGTPKNPDNPTADVDIGLAANSNIDAADVSTETGKFRTPTLRNIELTAPYMHNGVFSTLREVITHYDLNVAEYLDDPDFVSVISPEKVPEVTENIAEELKATLALDAPADYIDLENFLKTLTDGYQG
jgi:cytochrome c peroxidase